MLSVKKLTSTVCTGGTWVQDPQHTQLFLILSHKLVDRLKCHLTPFDVMIKLPIVITISDWERAKDRQRGKTACSLQLTRSIIMRTLLHGDPIGDAMGLFCAAR